MCFGRGAGSSAAIVTVNPPHSLRGEIKALIVPDMDAKSFIATPYLSLRRLLLARPLLRPAR